MKTPLTTCCFIIILMMISRQNIFAQYWSLSGNNLTGGEKLGSLNNFDVSIITNNAPHITVKSNGRIGIGTTSPLAKLDVKGKVALNDSLLLLRAGNDNNHGLRYASDLDGPYLFGFAGGALGTAGSPNALKWDKKGNVFVYKDHYIDNQNLNNGTFQSALKFGAPGTGEGISSSRIGSSGNFGLNFWAGNIIRMIIGNTGSVVIDPTNISNGRSAALVFGDPGLIVAGSFPGVGISSKRTTGGNYKGLDFYTGTANRMSITNNGNIGIGINQPTSKLEVRNGAIGISSSLKKWEMAYDTTDKYFYIDEYGFARRFVISNGGNIGIGTYTPTYKLDVCGTIRSKEIIVQAGWCDYVFDKNYKLRPLSEVDQYIQQNKHLPNIATAHEVETSGLKVGDMSAKMMEKIEELTLYLIDIDKRLQSLEKENVSLKQQIVNQNK